MPLYSAMSCTIFFFLVLMDMEDAGVDFSHQVYNIS